MQDSQGWKYIEKWIQDTMTNQKYEEMLSNLKAIKQIEDMKYEQELVSFGIKDIIKLAIVFKGKEVRITQGNV